MGVRSSSPVDTFILVFLTLALDSQPRQLARVVKGVDLKSTGLCPHWFESSSCRPIQPVRPGAEPRPPASGRRRATTMRQGAHSEQWVCRCGLMDMAAAYGAESSGFESQLRLVSAIRGMHIQLPRDVILVSSH